MEVAHFMTPDPITVRSDTSLDEAMEIMDDSWVRHLPVVDGGRLVGIVSDRDLLEATGGLHGKADGDSSKTIATVMHAPVTAHPDDRVVTLSVEIVLRGIGCLPVVDSGRVIGIVSELDLLRLYEQICRDRELVGDVDLPVRDCETRTPVTIEIDGTFEQAAQLLHAHDVRHLPVVDDGVLVGMLSDRDLRRAAGRGQSGAKVQELMTRDVVSVGPDDPMSAVAHIMVERKISAVPVVGESLEGIITTTDLLDHCMNTLRDPDIVPNRP